MESRPGACHYAQAAVQPFLDTVRGFLMGAANIVPGVSGGTLALVLGIYERLVHNMRMGADALAEVLV